MVNSLVDIELAHLNTAHPDFMGGSQAMRLIAQQLHSVTEGDEGNFASQYRRMVRSHVCVSGGAGDWVRSRRIAHVRKRCKVAGASEAAVAACQVRSCVRACVFGGCRSTDGYAQQSRSQHSAKRGSPHTR